MKGYRKPLEQEHGRPGVFCYRADASANLRITIEECLNIFISIITVIIIKELFDRRVCLTHVPRSNEDGEAFDFWVETMHVLELLDQLTEVLSLSHVFKHVRLLLAAGNSNVQSTVVHRSFDQLLNYSSRKHGNSMQSQFISIV